MDDTHYIVIDGETGQTHFWRRYGEGDWVEMRNGLPHYNCKSVTTWPEHPDTVFVQAGGNIYYRSATGGEGWYEVPFWETAIFGCSPVSNTVVSLSETHLRRSEDGGLTWDIIEEAGIPPLRYGLADIIMISDSSYIVYGDYGDISDLKSRIYRSDDSGITWQNLTPELGDHVIADIHLVDNDLYFTVIEMNIMQPYRGVYRYHWDTGEWTQLGEGILTDFPAFKLADDGEYLYGTIMHECVARYDLDTLEPEIIPADPVHHGTFRKIAVSPHDENRWLAKRGSLWLTENAGQNWTRLDSVYNCFGMVFDPIDPDRVIVSQTKRGIRISEDGGQTWFDSNQGIAPEDRHIISKLFTTQDGILFASGFEWIPGNPEGDTFIYRSADQGASWDCVMRSEAGEPWILIEDLAEWNGLILCTLREVGLAASEDDGLTWDIVLSIEGGGFARVEIDAAGGVYCMVGLEEDMGHNIKYSTDLSEWVTINQALFEDHITYDMLADPDVPGRLYTAPVFWDSEFQNRLIVWTEDYGGTWHNWRGDGTIFIDGVHTLQTVGDDILICPSGHSILRTGRELSAGGDIPAPGRISLSNYPNPFNPKTTISFNLPRAGHTELAIYNVRGQLVRTLVDRKLPAGDHNIVWQGADDRGSRCPSGMYLFRLHAGGKTVVNKGLMLK